MPQRHVVVDGSNIATESRNLPSLQQLNEAVLAWLEENPDDQITVVVDATFGHRIDDSEKQAFDEARDAGELVTPPAGAIGRGDAFVLRIAEKTGAVVLSNDSFQEFHGEHEWLFSKGRLIGGTPVGGIGWIFTPRNPVRGPKSRDAVRDAKRQKARIGSPEASQPMPVPKSPPPSRTKKKDGAVAKGAKVDKAIAAAVDEAEAPGSKRKKRRRKGGGGGGGGPAEPVNEPATFLQFVMAYKPGEEVQGVVDNFSSHGAFVLVDDARCYIPLSAMGEPAPRAARDVLNRGETRTFVVQALDTPRRGIELALPGFAHIASEPTQETIDAEIGKDPAEGGRKGRGRDRSGSGRRRRSEEAADSGDATVTDGADPAGGRSDGDESGRRRRKPAAVDAAGSEPAAEGPAKRTRKAAASGEEATAAAPAKRSRKATPAATDEAEPAAPAKRSRKAAASAPAGDAAPADTAPAKRSRKAAAAEAAPAEAAPAKRSRKAAAAEAAPAEAAPAKRSRKVAATAAGTDSAPAEAAPAKRTRKAAAAAATPAPDAGGAAPADATPAKRTRKAAAPAAGVEAAAAENVPAKRSRKAAATAPQAEVAAPADAAPAKRTRKAAGATKGPAPAADAAPAKRARKATTATGAAKAPAKKAAKKAAAPRTRS